MGLVKDLWLDEVEQIAEQLVEDGMDEAEAYDLACERGEQALLDRWADMADAARDRAKYAGF